MKKSHAAIVLAILGITASFFTSFASHAAKRTATLNCSFAQDLNNFSVSGLSGRTAYVTYYVKAIGAAEYFIPGTVQVSPFSYSFSNSSLPPAFNGGGISGSSAYAVMRTSRNALLATTPVVTCS